MRRAAFEAWAKPRHIQLDRDLDWPDKYVNEYVQSMWNGWQAATARAEGVVTALKLVTPYAKDDDATWAPVPMAYLRRLRRALKDWEEGDD